MSARFSSTLAEIRDEAIRSIQKHGEQTHLPWWLILREEVFEAAAEDDPAELRAELVQVAAVALKMIDALDATSPNRGKGGAE